MFVSGSFRLDLGRIEIKNWKLEFNVNIKLQISANPKRHPEFNPRAEKLEARSLNREVFWSLKSFNCKQEHMQKRFALSNVFRMAPGTLPHMLLNGYAFYLELIVHGLEGHQTRITAE